MSGVTYPADRGCGICKGRCGRCISIKRWSISWRDDPSPAASLQEMHPHPSPSISRLQTMSPSVEIDALCVHRNAFTLSREICPLCTPSTSLFGDGRWRCGICGISRGIWISRSTLQSKMMKNFFIVGRREMEMRDMGHLPREMVHLPRDMHIPGLSQAKNRKFFFKF